MYIEKGYIFWNIKLVIASAYLNTPVPWVCPLKTRMVFEYKNNGSLIE